MQNHSIKRLAKDLLLVLKFITVCSFIALLLITLTSQSNYLIELTSHFVVIYSLTFAISALLFSLRREKSFLILSSLGLVISLFMLKDFYFHEDNSPSNASAPLKIMHANIHSPNKNYADFLSLVEKNNPDLLVLIEVNDLWTNEIKKLKKIYPHQIIHPREDNFGMAIISKIALKNYEVTPLGPKQPPSIIAELAINNKTLKILATHPLPPVSQNGSTRRNQQLISIAQFAKEQRQNTIVIGDLNATPWSAYFQTLVKDSGLKDARLGFGLNATWPNFLPFTFMPIDHCLVSQNINITSFQAINIQGSDHRGLVVELML